MASEPTSVAGDPTSSNPLFYVAGVIALLGAGVWGYTEYVSRQASGATALTPEAKAYARNLQLSDVEMKASENYFRQTVVEISGHIANAGTRPLDTVEIYCIFDDPYGQLRFEGDASSAGSTRTKPVSGSCTRRASHGSGGCGSPGSGRV